MSERLANFLLASGIVAWGLVFLALSTLLALFIWRHWRGRLIETPSLYPIVRFSLERSAAWVMGHLKAAGILPYVPITQGTLDGWRRCSLSQLQHIRRIYTELDQLPTIVKGKNALGIKSIFQTVGQSVATIPSPYTHPLQTPRYYLPGVPATAFFDTDELPWVSTLEEAFPVIRQELEALLQREGEGFRSLVAQNGDTVRGWNSFNFFFFSQKYEQNCLLCPNTTAVLESMPMLEKEQIMFSALNPNTEVTPHVGPMNGIIRAHLPLIVPDGCGIRVGGIERSWTEGEVLAFDDSFLHEAWNRGQGVRIVLFMNFWNPCFSEDEIAVLRRFRTAYEGAPLAQQFAANMARERGHDLPELNETTE